MNSRTALTTEHEHFLEGRLSLLIFLFCETWGLFHLILTRLSVHFWEIATCFYEKSLKHRLGLYIKNFDVFTFTDYGYEVFS